MTLAPNHRQPLSGSRSQFQLLVLALILFVLASCGGSKKTTRPGYKRPDVSVTPEKNPPSKGENLKEDNRTVDTITWQEIPAEISKPITSPKALLFKEASRIKPLYNVALLAPFRAAKLNQGEELSGNYKRFIDFYTGVQLAARQLEKEGIDLNVKVFDTEYDDQKGNLILKDPYLKACDLIIGPYKRNLLKNVIEFGKENKITVVSPWISSNSLTSSNPYYLQIKPSLTRHYETIRDHIQKSLPGVKPILIIKEGDLSKWNDLSSIFTRNDPASLEQGSFFSDTLIIRNDSLLPEKTVFIRLLEKEESPVFFIPYASSQDESFVYTLLRKLNIDRKEKQVMVYGPGTWLDYREEVLDLFTTLSLRFSVSNLFMPDAESSKALVKEYYENFGSVISSDAAEGFDLFYYLGKELKARGTYFQAFGNQDVLRLNQTGMDIRAIPNMNNEGGYGIDFFENFYIQIMEYIDFQFRIVP